MSSRRIDLFVALAAFLLVLSALASPLDRDGGRDWDYFQADLVAARDAILNNGELPFWMPFRGGGHDAFADPQSTWFSPLGLLVLLFDFPMGTRLFLATCAAVGALGTLRLCQHIGLSIYASVLATISIVLSTPMGLYAAGGIPGFSCGLMVLPWLILAVSASRPSGFLNLRWGLCAAGGCLLAMTLYCGGPNQFVLHSLFLLFVSTALSVLRKRPTPFVATIALGVFAGIVAAPKMIPMWMMSRDHPRLTSSEPSAMTLGLTYQAYLNAYPGFMEVPQGEFIVMLETGEWSSLNSLDDQARQRVVTDTAQDWVNFGSYLGWAVLTLAAIGASRIGRLWGAKKKKLALESRVIVAQQSQATGKNHRKDKRKGRSPKKSQVEQPIDAPETIFSILIWKANDPSWDRVRERKTLLVSLLLSGFVFYWLSFGSNAVVDAWKLLHHLPVFSSMRNPARLLVYLLTPISLLAALGFDHVISVLCSFSRAMFVHVAVSAVIVFVLLDVHLPARPLYGIAFCEPRLKLEDSGIGTVVGETERSGFPQIRWDGRKPDTTLYAPPVTPAVRAGVGLVNGYGVFDQQTNVDGQQDSSYRGFSFFEQAGRGRILDDQISSRFIEFAYETPEGGTVVINQNAYQGWKVLSPNAAILERSSDGRMAVKLPEGEGIVRLRYSPPGFGTGLAVSISGIVLALAGAFVSRRQALR